MGGSVYIAASATVTGDVSMGTDSSVWHGAVVRADCAPITIGARSNVQDNVTIHVDPGFPVRVGEGVSIGHNAIVHGCTVGDNTIIGMGAILLNGARVGRDCIVGAGALVTQGTEIPDGSLAFGSPARVRRAMSPDEIGRNRDNALEYVQLAQRELPLRSS